MHNSCWLGEEPDVSHGFPEFQSRFLPMATSTFTMGPLKTLDEPYLVNDKFYVGVEFELISVTNTC
uniref:MATH domain-containing protein n=1 Tax=Brassica campestris TaxID=3711 RepID=A0A3P6A1U4_BRACM|nr:unnamed protein product [Brassica rapa]